MTIFQEPYFDRVATNRKNDTYSYNAYFECGGDRFPVNITNFQYGWNLKTVGSANSRQFQVVYPKRPEQSALTIGLVFRDRQEYYDFGAWVRAYHLKATSGINPPVLIFACSIVYAYYSVAITNLPMSFSWDMDSAPQIKSLTLMILQDMLDASGSSTSINGSESSLISDRVGSWEVRGVGETAYFPNVQKVVDAPSTPTASAESIFDEHDLAGIGTPPTGSERLRHDLGMF